MIVTIARDYSSFRHLANALDIAGIGAHQTTGTRLKAACLIFLSYVTMRRRTRINRAMARGFFTATLTTTASAQCLRG
jgi:hypothetical protein